MLDRHEVGADAHRHVLDVREDLVGHLVSVVSDPDFDLHLAYRVRIEVRLAEVYGDYGEIAVTNAGKTVATWGEGFSYTGPGGTWFNVQR